MNAPRWFFPKARACPYIRKAAEALRAGNAADAQASAERALAIYPNAAEAYYALGKAAELGGDRHGAIAQYGRGLGKKNIMPDMPHFPTKGDVDYRVRELGRQLDDEERETGRRAREEATRVQRADSAFEGCLKIARLVATSPGYQSQLGDRLFDLWRQATPEDMRRYAAELGIAEAEKPKIYAHMQEMLIGRAYQDIVEPKFKQWDGRSHPGTELIALTADWVGAMPSSLDALWYHGATNARAYLATADTALYDAALRDARKLQATAGALGVKDNRGERLETWLGKLKAKHGVKRAQPKP